jgi:hypothetical protein
MHTEDTIERKQTFKLIHKSIVFFNNTLEGRSQVERDELVPTQGCCFSPTITAANSVCVCARKMMVITLTLIGLIAMGDRLN